MIIICDSAEIKSENNRQYITITNLNEIKFDKYNALPEVALVLEAIGLDLVKEYFGLE